MVFTKITPLLAIAALAITASTTSAFPRVDSGVHRTLRAQGTVNLIVTMAASTKSTLESVQEADFASRGDLIADLVNRLESHAQETQQVVGQVLAQEATSATPMYSSYQSYWISNQLYIQDASLELVEKLSALSQIQEVREEQILPVPKPIASSVNTTTEAASIAATTEWGVTKVGAPTVWATGNTGQNVVVSSIDTGVHYTHEAVKANFRSSYGWFDPEKKSATPYDEQGHGTHTMATIAGTQGVGVAYGATWISCKGCRTDGCSESDLLTCAQFITCPTDTSGNNKDCSKAPNVVSNSWGGGQGDTFYQAAVDAWIKAGIIPVFANGNEGPACTTASSPGDYANVIAVGATDSTDGLASFSSKGPSTGGLLKPEVSAPGYNVRSAWYTGDSAYNTISGTSMATPHVSGVIALLLSAKPGLSFDQVKSIITTSVDTATLKAAGYTCGSTADGTFPNNNFGYGRLNAVKAVAGGSTPTSAPTSSPTAAPTVTPTPTTTPAPTTKAPTPVPTTQAPTPTPTSADSCAQYKTRATCYNHWQCDWASRTKTCYSWV